jgi:hypothetical protein
VTGPLEPRRSLADYADLIHTYGIPDEEIRRWIDSNPRWIDSNGRPVPVVPGALYVRPPAAAATPHPVQRILIWPIVIVVLAVLAAIAGGYAVYRYPPNPPAPCHPGACQMVTPTTYAPPPR